MAWTPPTLWQSSSEIKEVLQQNLWGLTASQCLFCQNITSEPKMQKHERNKKRLRWSLEIRPRYSISHHVVAISPRWLNTNLRPKNCNPTAVATLLFSSAKFCPTKSHMPVFYYLTPLIVSCEETPPLLTSWPTTGPTKKHLTLPRTDARLYTVWNKKKSSKCFPPSVHFLPFEGMLPQVCSLPALSPSWFLGLPHQIPKSHGFI